MLLRTSHALVVCPENGETVAFNFLKRTAFVCTTEILQLLHHLRKWRSINAICNRFKEMDSDEVKQCVEDLVSIGGVVIKSSPEHEEERNKVDAWQWGLPSAMQHYATQDQEFLTLEEAGKVQKDNARGVPEPSLYTRNSQYDVRLPLPQSYEANRLLQLMAARRTVRGVEKRQISQEVIADCLFAGLGITGETENCVSRLPLSMTPSGGARNPFEAYIFAEKVEGLPKGTYHYSAYDHDLGFASDRTDIPIERLIGNQDWGANMSCVILLCADFERSMWKYKDSNAYRVLMIEAGHIAQNIMLAATRHGCTACPTAALAHSEIAELAGLDGVMKSPIYAIALGKLPLQEAFPANLIPEIQPWRSNSHSVS